MKLPGTLALSTSLLTTILYGAEELTIHPAPLTIEHSIEATAWPEDGLLPIPTAPKAWENHIIKDIKAHGSHVGKGEVLVAFESLDLNKKIASIRRSITAKSLTLEQAEQELSHQSATLEIRLAQLRTAADIAQEEHAYFNKTRRDAESRQADQALEYAKQYLANQTEELRQLEKMYEADEVTEETEEIILTRQRYKVTDAKFDLEMAELRRKRIQDIQLPREAMSLSDAERDSSIALKKAEQELPRAIAIKKNEIESLSAELKEEAETLAELEHDQKHLLIAAPSDGWFLHGTITGGRWQISEATSKLLLPGGRPPMSQPCATFIPDACPVQLHSHMDAGVANQLTAGMKGIASPLGRSDLQSITTIDSVAPVPGTDGKHHIIMHADWKKAPTVGGKFLTRFVSYQKDNTISIPTKALVFGPDGDSVRLKLADGKIEKRKVKTGRTHGKETEILSGLEVDQVIMVP